MDDLGTGNWFRVSHVCRHWRRAALSSQASWDHIYPGSSSTVSLFVERAGSRPLHFQGGQSHRSTDQMLQSLQTYRSRFVDVLVSFSEASGKDLLRVFRKSRCNLKSLRIWCLDDSDLVEDVPPLLAFTNGSTAPQDLQSLTLFGALVHRRTWKDVASYRHLSWLCLVNWPAK